MSKVTFDYSKAAPFISAHEVEIMKKAITFILSLVFLCSLAVPAMAAGETVVYMSDSSFVAGGTVKVNEQKTKQNIMDLG